MSKSAIAVEGFVSNEPRTREAGSHTVVDVSVPVTPQRLKDGKWEDSGDTVWYKASFWNDHVPAILTSVDKGSLVQMTGDGVKVSTYEKDGALKVSLEITNPVIAVVVRKPKKGASATPSADTWATQSPADDWSQPQQEPVGDVWNAPGSYNDETPF